MLSGCEGKSLASKAKLVASRNMVFQGSAACPVGLAEGLERGGMARGKNALTAVSIRQSGVGRLIDGGGLMVDKTGEATGKWIWRYSFAGKRRDMGLGPWPDVSLADARRARDRWAAVLLSGLDPISERDRIRAAERAETAAMVERAADWIEFAPEGKRSTDAAAIRTLTPADATAALDQIRRQERAAGMREAAEVVMAIGAWGDMANAVPDEFDEGTSAAYEAILDRAEAILALIEKGATE